MSHSAGGICRTLWAVAGPEISPSGCLPTTIPLQIPPAETWDLQLEAIICFTHRIVAPIGKDQLGKMVCSTSSCCGAGKSRRGPTRPLNFSCWEMTRTMGRKPTSTMGQRSWHKCSAESRSLPRSVVRDRRQTGSSSRCSGWPRLPHRPF